MRLSICLFGALLALPAQADAPAAASPFAGAISAAGTEPF